MNTIKSKLPTALKVSLLTFVCATMLSAGTILTNFHAQPSLNKVTLKWNSQNEINLKGFDVERSFEEKSNFRKVDFVKAAEQQSAKSEYIFEDQSVFKSSERTFYYRLKIIDNDDSFTFSKVISVSPTISSARQTWGSIKAMFR